MLNVALRPPTGAVRVWMVQLKVEFPATVGPAAGDDDLEPMVELMTRTEGVRFAVVVPRPDGLAVALGLSAPDAKAARDRARSLVSICARFAGLGLATVRLARATSEPTPERA